MTKSCALPLEMLRREFDKLLEKMQSAKSKKGVKAFLRATPAQLGQSALKASTTAAFRRRNSRRDLRPPPSVRLGNLSPLEAVKKGDERLFATVNRPLKRP
jgi:hypothetical protein